MKNYLITIKHTSRFKTNHAFYLKYTYQENAPQMWLYGSARHLADHPTIKPFSHVLQSWTWSVKCWKSWFESANSSPFSLHDSCGASYALTTSAQRIAQFNLRSNFSIYQNHHQQALTCLVARLLWIITFRLKIMDKQIKRCYFKPHWWSSFIGQ